MISVKGLYQDGIVTLDKQVNIDHPAKVIVTFVDDEDSEAEPAKRHNLSDFNFAKSRELLKDVKGSLSDAVIEERRSAL